MPISFRSAFAAGAAAAAAQQDGKTEHEQLQQAEVASMMVDKLDASGAAQKPVAGAPPQEPLQAVAAAHADGVKREEILHRKPTQPPGPGFLNHLARWLNLK